jgi:hypothetical protein
VKTCSKHTKPRRVDSKTGHSPTPSANVTTVSWTTLLEEIHLQAQGQVDLDRFIEFDENHPGVTGDTLLVRANTVMDRIKTAAGYRFKFVQSFILPSCAFTLNPKISFMYSYKRRQDSTQKARRSTVFTYYCAQLEGEQTKHALHPDERRRRPKKLPKIPRFHCNGWASLTVTEEVPTIMRLRMTHAFAHVACFSNRPAGAGVGKPRPSGSSFSNSARLVQSDPTSGSLTSPLHISTTHDMSAEGFDVLDGSPDESQQPLQREVQADYLTSPVRPDASIVSNSQSVPFVQGSENPVMDGVEQGSEGWPAPDIDPSERVSPFPVATFVINTTRIYTRCASPKTTSRI